MAATEVKSLKSITWRLRIVMISIALFFIISAVGIYVSSIGFFEGLQKIYTANLIVSLANESQEALETSNVNLEKLRTKAKLKDVRFAFFESQKFLKKSIGKAILESEHNQELKDLLEKSLDSIYQYESSVTHLFDSYAKGLGPEVLNSEMLIVNQFAIDAIEYLRKSQIMMRSQSDLLFNSIYSNRFRPLVVAVTLSGFFFLFVITFGFSTANKISSSIQALKKAATNIREGNLNYQAPVLDQDEFGVLSDTFNQMVQSLNLSLDRIRSLQKITAKFSEALTADQVIDVTIKEALNTLNADSGAVSLKVGDGSEIEMIGILGFDDDTIKKWKRFSLEIKTPSTDSIRNHKPNILLSRAEILNKYPHLEKDVVANRIYSMGSFPLNIGDTSIGSLSFNFCTEKTFSEEEIKFMEALGGLCAQALYRSKLYDDARIAIQVRDEFLSIASHELKTPLTPLKLQLQLMARKIKNEPEKLKEGQLEKMLNNADRQMNRLAKLIDDLLDVSRISAGKLKLHPEVVNLQDIIRDVLVQYSHELEANLGHVELEAPEAVYCNVDSLRIEQVLVNLLTNAVKYAPMKNIMVNLTKDMTWARISVKDQGPGIAQEDLERIFGRFERVRTSDNIGGLGLGLYISKQIIEAHSGKIYAESDGSGSTFIVELPLAQNV